VAGIAQRLLETLADFSLEALRFKVDVPPDVWKATSGEIPAC